MNQHVPVAEGDRLAKRNALILSGAQALGGANPAIVVSLGGLVGAQLASDKTFATVPVSLLQLGIAAGVIPAAMLMRRLGRRGGYLIGALVGATGASLAAGGVVSRHFWLFCLGTFVCGLYGSFVQSYRFAAADTASPGFRPRAISWVMLGGLAAGVIGPQSVYWTRDLTPAAPFAASFLAQGALALLAICIVSQLHAPPVKAVRSDLGRPLGQIVRQPKELLAKAGFVVKEPREGHLCCGSAGTYNMLQPELSQRLKARKLANIAKVTPDIIATGNIGCMTQLASGPTPIVHTIELLDWAYGGPKPEGL